MRFLQKIVLFAILITAMSPFTRVDADQTYFLIKGENGKSVQFPVTDAVLAKLEMVSFKALLPGMDDKLHTVRGPLIRDLLAAAGVQGETTYARALDRYEVEMPTADFRTFDVIAAMEVDGRVIDVRHKGPAWIVYPTADYPELQRDPVYEARSIWQLKELVVK